MSDLVQFPHCRIIDILDTAVKVEVGAYAFWVRKEQIAPQSEVRENWDEGTLVLKKRTDMDHEPR